MPDKNDWGKSLENDVEIDAYLDLLNSKNQRNSDYKDFSSVSETLSHETVKGRFSDFEDDDKTELLNKREENISQKSQIGEEETISLASLRRGTSSTQRSQVSNQQRVLNNERNTMAQRNNQQGASSQRKATVQKPAPPQMKKNGKTIDIEKQRKNSKNPVIRWFYNLSKGKQRLLKVVSVFLALILIFCSAVGIFINSKFQMMGNINEYTDVIYEEEQFSDIDGDINASNFKDALKKWATTGNEEKMSSKNVVNVLLIGADSRQGTNTGNTDVMMLVSLNKKTKQIKLVSFLRDSYLYVEGKNNAYCMKLNAAFSMGGPEILMNTIENNYKIEIDDFVMVNFESFKSIIEAMDGVTVDVQKYEANYANNRYHMSMPYGDDVTLTGEEALAFCRIRGCDADGDVSRTRRQRQVINAIMDRVKNASVSDLNKYLNALLPYIYTGFTQSEILSLGMQAITNGWASFQRKELQIPTPETRTSGNMGGWIWVIDYQLAAHTLQNELYGTSNITLEEGRTTLIDIYNGTSGSGSSDGGSSSSIDSGNNTTVPPSTEPETYADLTVPEESTEEDMGSPDIDIPTEENTEGETDSGEDIPVETEPEVTENETIENGETE